MTENLPKELTSLVDWSVTELGHVIEAQLGKKMFLLIEKTRRFIKSKDGQSVDGLQRLKNELQDLSSEEQYSVAHSFSLMLELINACEAAYRTHRLKLEKSLQSAFMAKKYGQIIQVLTAHPTESRNPDIIFYFRKIQSILEKHLSSAAKEDLEELRTQLTSAWFIPMAKQRKPTVMDEAEYIYSLALQKEILDLYVEQRSKKMPFYIRTWVGGDKDGHPGVDEKTLRGSLQMSRKILYQWCHQEFKVHLQEIAPLVRTAHLANKDLQKLGQLSQQTLMEFGKLRALRKDDAKRIQKFRNILYELIFVHKKFFSVPSRSLEQIKEILKVFPGLVVPLELREDSRLVHEALKLPKKPLAITRMLKELSAISGGADPRIYVRGFILSQTESVDDLVAGLKLSEKILGQARLPVIPLFESAHSLENSVKIITDFLKVGRRKKIVQKFWSSHVEVMLGYSDSAKENGAFASRFLIYSSLQRLQDVIHRNGLIPIFFHGSGGSIERGGGSVQEQTEWWPPSALETVKVTVQGEMVYRNFSSVEILERQLERFAHARDEAVKKSAAMSSEDGGLFLRMSESVQKSYQSILKQDDFLKIIEKGTPYSFLKDLKMGSRPSKRQGSVQIRNLRAIPWVLCWTQTRVLFPTWWGVGSFWNTLNNAEKKKYRALFKKSSFFSSYLKALGFTLAKVDLNVFAFYLHSSAIEKSVVDKYLQWFESEFESCKAALAEITEEESVLWYRPWLETSIQLRSPLINPLNVLQLIALQSKDTKLLRETVAGVASGMLTTG